MMDISTRDSVGDYTNMENSRKGPDKTEAVVITFAQSARAIAFTGALNWLLLATPVAIISYAAKWPDEVTFVFSLIALAPLAERLGYITEQLAFHTNETIGGLLNATFGNATELIVSITALNRGLYRLVQLSLLGSVLSNMLLVLGTSFLLGGLRNKTQYFGTVSSQINSSLLVIATMGILFPTILTSSNYESNLGLLGLSRGASVVLFLMYLAFLAFQVLLYDNVTMFALITKFFLLLQLFTHKDIYEERLDIPKSSGSGSETTSALHTSATECERDEETKGGDGDKAGDDDDEDEDELGFTNALIWLGIATALIAVLSDALSASIQKAANSANISGVFIAAIVLPIVGNAAEHAGAVMFAMKGKLDLTLGVAIGSSTQISLCVLPFVVIIAWMMDKPLDLDFGNFEGSALLLTILTVTFIIKDGKSNWLLGAALIGAYIIISIAFLSHLNEPLDA